MSAADKARARAAKTRAVIDGCRRILADPAETPERRAKAREVLDRALGVQDADYPSFGALMAPPGRGTHRRSGDMAVRSDIDYNGERPRRG